MALSTQVSQMRGTPFCASIDVANERLRRAIEDAEAAGAAGPASFPEYQRALEVFDAHTGLDSSLVYVPFIGNQCALDTAEVQKAADDVIRVLKARGAATSDAYRPEAQDADLTRWVKPVLWLGGLVAAAYALNALAGAKRAFAGHSRKRRRRARR